MSRERFACGCVADDRAWLALCAAHATEHATYRAAHFADMAARREPPGQAVALGKVAAHDGA